MMMDELLVFIIIIILRRRRRTPPGLSWRFGRLLARLLEAFGLSWEALESLRGGSREPFGTLRGTSGSSQGSFGRHLRSHSRKRTIMVDFCTSPRSVLELKNCIFNIEDKEKLGSKRRSAKDAFCIPFWMLFCIDSGTEFDAMLGRFCDAVRRCRA